MNEEIHILKKGGEGRSNSKKGGLDKALNYFFLINMIFNYLFLSQSGTRMILTIQCLF